MWLPFVTLPLAGVRVLEIGQVISAPYATLLLADLGAEVTKIEPPGTGDSARDPSVTGHSGKSATFLTLNRNKRSVCLNLRDGDDYLRFRDLVKGADVVLTNVVPATAERLRIDPDSLRAGNDRLIVCRILGFRADDPAVDKPSYDLTHQASTGYMMLGGLEGDPPSRIPVPIADLTVAMFAAYAVLAALVDRNRTGLGDLIDVPMSDALLSTLTYSATLFLNRGVLPERLGSAHPHTTPWQAYRAADGFFVVAVRSDRFWRRLCDAVEIAELRAEEFTTNAGRLAHRARLEATLNATFARRRVHEWLRLLDAAGVPCAPVRTIGDALTAEAARDSPILQQFEDPDMGPVRIVGNPVRFTRLSTATPAPAPELGEHNQRGAGG